MMHDADIAGVLSLSAASSGGQITYGAVVPYQSESREHTPAGAAAGHLPPLQQPRLGPVVSLDLGVAAAAAADSASPPAIAGAGVASLLQASPGFGAAQSASAESGATSAGVEAAVLAVINQPRDGVTFGAVVPFHSESGVYAENPSGRRT